MTLRIAVIVLGAERCPFGMPFVQAMIEPDGKLKATIRCRRPEEKMICASGLT